MDRQEAGRRVRVASSISLTYPMPEMWHGMGAARRKIRSGKSSPCGMVAASRRHAGILSSRASVGNECADVHAEIGKIAKAGAASLEEASRAAFASDVSMKAHVDSRRLEAHAVLFWSEILDVAQRGTVQTQEKHRISACR